MAGHSRKKDNRTENVSGRDRKRAKQSEWDNGASAKPEWGHEMPTRHERGQEAPVRFKQDPGGRSRARQGSGKSAWPVVVLCILGALLSAALFLAVVPKITGGPGIIDIGAAGGSASGSSTIGIGAAGGSASGEEDPGTAKGEAILPESDYGAEDAEAAIFGDEMEAAVSGDEAEAPKYEKQVISAYVETTAPPETEAPEPVTMVFAGDILFDPNYAVMATLLNRTGGKPTVEEAFDEASLQIMRDADFFAVNNEFPYSKRGTALANKAFTFRADPAYASLLPDMGVDLVMLANNHMFDHGEEALLDTLDTLTALEMPYIGAGRDITEAAAEYTLEAEGMKISFLNATQIERFASSDTRGATDTLSGVFRCLDDTLLLQRIREVSETSDITVVYVHWGTESTEKVDEHQKKLAKHLAEAGADLIIGDHPHVLQGIEFIDGVPCIYSLGNYFFNSKAQDSCLFAATADPETKSISEIRFIPARQEGCRVSIPSPAEQTRIIAYMNGISTARINEEGIVTP